ncbi:MAG: hypothetical protein FJ358_08150 [Thaumarchaeota archaeon]|nr:hypothetical protein [Nitrososphaerota archaeon]
MKVSLARTKGYVSKLPVSTFKNIILAERDEIELSDLISKLETWEILLNQEMSFREKSGSTKLLPAAEPVSLGGPV